MKLGRMYDMFCIVTNCIVINFFVILGLLFGLIIFGIGPSLIACQDVFKNFHLQKAENSLFQIFFRSYKKNFIKGNKLFLPLLVVLCIYVFDINVFQELHFFDSKIFILFLLLILLFFISLFCCIAPMFSFYNLKTIQYYTKTVRFLINNLLVVILSLLWLGFCVYGAMLLPGTIPFVAIGIWSMGNSAIFWRSFIRNEEFVNNNK